MTTRRNILKSGAGLAAILATGKAPAYLVKSMVASRGSFLGRGAGGGGWANPYVTDGLVAMWDGEWNAGGGVHDPNAATWKDLAGTFDASVAGTPSFGDNFANVNANSYWIISDTIAPTVLSQNLTAEVVFSAGDSTILNQCVLAFGPTASSSRILYLFFGQYPQNKNTNLFFTYKGKQSPIRPTGSGVFGTGVHSASLVVSSGVYDGYFDMTLKTSGNVGGNITTWSGVAQIGKGTNAFGGRIYCVRMYNRPLQESELAANNATDRKRFGIT